MAIHALAPQCALSVLSYSEYKIAKMFQGFSPGYHWGGLTAPRRPASCTTGFVLAMLVEKRTFPKNWYIYIYICTSLLYCGMYISLLCYIDR